MNRNELGGFIVPLYEIGAESRHPSFGAGTLCEWCGMPLDGDYRVVSLLTGREPAPQGTLEGEAFRLCFKCYAGALAGKEGHGQPVE